MNVFLILLWYFSPEEVKMLEYDVYLLGEKTENLVIFLQGYNGTIATHQYAIDWLTDGLQDAVLIVPHAPEISDKNPERFQWFGMLKYDANNLRTKPETSTEEIFAIYNRTANDMDRCAYEINSFINDMQKIYQIEDKHTFLCGFSQGAMLTIYTALTRPTELGGAFVLSGLVAGADSLAAKIRSRPQMYMFHGKDDLRVQFKTLEQSQKLLTEHNVPLQIQVFDNLEHKMSEEEIAFIADKINSTL